MKKNQAIIRMLMALVVAFGVETTASAQFGGLLKKAKQAVKDKVDSEEYRAKAKVRDKIEDAENNAVNKVVNNTIGSSVDVENDDYSGSNSNSNSSHFSSNLGGYKPQFDVDFSKAKHAEWDYTSGGTTVEADFAYWMQRLVSSMSSSKPDALDWEAAFRVNTGKPSFDFLDNTYHLWDGEKLTEYNAEQWQFERKAVLKRMQEIEAIGIPQSPNTDGLDKEAKARKLGQYMVTKANAQLKRATKNSNSSARLFHFYRAFGSLSTGVTMKWTNGSESGFSDMASTMQTLYNELPADYKADFPSAYDIASLQAFDAQRKAAAKTKKDNEEVFKMKKGSLLTQYRTTQQKGETCGAISGHAAWLEELVKSNCPEWGTVLASKVHTDYKVEVNRLGIPLYRTFTSEVMCEDQGFRVVHEVFLKQDYQDGKYGRNEIRPGGLKWNAKCSIVK